MSFLCSYLPCKTPRLVFLWNLLWTWNQNSLKFPAFLELTNSDVIKFYFQQFYDNFPDHSMIMKAKKVIFIIPISQQCCFQFVLNFGIYFFHLINTLDSDEKMSKFWFIWPFNIVYFFNLFVSYLGWVVQSPIKVTQG